MNFGHEKDKMKMKVEMGTAGRIFCRVELYFFNKLSLYMKARAQYIVWIVLHNCFSNQTSITKLKPERLHRFLFAFYRAIKVKLKVCKQTMGIITKVIQFVSVLTLTKCIVDLFKFLRWDGRYQLKLPFFAGQSRGMVCEISLSLSLTL